MDIKSRQPRDSQPEVARSPKPLKGRKKGTGVTKRGMLLALVVLAFAGMAGYIVYQQIQLNEYRNNPTKAAQDEQARIVGLIRKHYKIPTYTKSVDGKDTTVEDAPEIASITDKTKLTGQAFFNNAENGDYIVVFPNNKTALIYREKTDQIINSGPVTVDANQQATTLNVKLFGLAKDRDAAQTKIDAAFPGSTVITKVDATTKLTTTIVVDISGKNTTAAQQLASKLTNAKVGSVPAGEATPTDTDMAIYVAAQ